MAMSEEQKRRMAEGRKLAAERRKRQAELAKPGDGPAAEPVPAEIPQETAPEPPKPLKRRRRPRLDGMNMKLHLEERPGFKRRWVRDDPDDKGSRVQYFHDNLAYDFVRNADGEPVRRPGGGGVTMVAMETPIEEFEAGQKEKQQQLDAMDQTLLRGVTEDGTALQDQTGFYGQAKVGRES